MGRHFKSRTRETANPPDLGSGDARRDTGASDHFLFPREVKAACRSVTPDVMVRVHAGEPFFIGYEGAIEPA